MQETTPTVNGISAMCAFELLELLYVGFSWLGFDSQCRLKFFSWNINDAPYGHYSYKMNISTSLLQLLVCKLILVQLVKTQNHMK